MPLDHSVTPIVAENHNVNRRGVIGDTDSSFSGFIFPVVARWRHEVSIRRYSWSLLRRYTVEEEHSPVVIMDGGGESSSTDPVAYHVDPFTEPELNPKNKPHTHKQTGTNKKGYIWNMTIILVCSHLHCGSNPTADVPMTNQVRPMQASVILEKVEHMRTKLF